ncbi:MAG TPA: cupin domain-containing protein [Gaiellaceae bacterium]|nr:cupin domain-containing protein [Gaiellaceae bacterium]
MDPVVSRPGDGERFERENRTITILVDLPGLSVLEIAFDETFTVDPHTHDDHTDSFLVLDGEVEFTVGDETIRAGPGTLVAAPPGSRHGFRSAGRPARVLNFHTPDAGFAGSIRGYRP